MLRKIILLLSLALIITGCNPNRNEVNGEKVLKFSLGDDVNTLDPANAYDSVSLTVMPLTMESLYQYSYLKRPVQLEPLLAESMPTVSKDKLTYTFKIKKGIRFQDDPAFKDGKGRELTAEDFAYAWKRLIHPDVRSNGAWIFEDKVIGYTELKKKLNEAPEADRESLLRSEFEGIKATDRYTLQVKLHRPYPQLLYVISMGFGAPMATEVIDKYTHKGLNRRMVGTGPFVMKEFVAGSKIIMAKNPNFRKAYYPSEGDAEAKEMGLLAAAGKQIPFVDGINFKILKESQPQWLEFNRGQLDRSGIPKDNFDTAIVDNGLSGDLITKKVSLYKYDRPVIWYLNFNLKDPIVGKNANLRKAMVRAIDRDYIIKIFLNGRATKATSITPPGIDGHIKRPATIGDFSLEEAKKYLKLAGYPNGEGLPEIKYDIRGSSTTARQMGEYIKKALGKIGIKVKVVVNTFPAYLKKERTGNLQFFMGGWAADYPDSENFLQLLYSKNVTPGPNATNYENKAFDKLYLKSAAMSPSKSKESIIKEAEELVFNESVWSMLYYPTAFSLYHDWLKNYRPNELINNAPKYFDIDLEAKKKLIQAKF